MALQILICDDSSMARKQIARSLPEDLDAEVRFAVDGVDALDQLGKQNADLLFLDLNMPELDGYGVLQSLQRKADAPQIVVVSADIQPEAQRKVNALGAKGFLKKPFAKELVAESLKELGMMQTGQLTGAKQPTQVPIDDALREIANVSMGHAADKMARVLDSFFELPVPKLRRLMPGELEMLLRQSAQDSALNIISQGFTGDGIVGEALLLFEPSSFESIGRLMGMQDINTPEARVELQMETANILFVGFLNALAQQLHIPFSQSRPVSLTRIPTFKSKQKTLAIEIAYRLSDHGILCDLLILLPETSLPRLEKSLRYIME